MAVMRSCLRCLVHIDNNRDLQEGNKQQLRNTTVVKEQFGRLMLRALRIVKKDVYIENRNLVRAAKNNLSVLSLLEWDPFLGHDWLRMQQNTFSDMYLVFTLNP